MVNKVVYIILYSKRNVELKWFEMRHNFVASEHKFTNFLRSTWNIQTLYFKPIFDPH